QRQNLRNLFDPHAFNVKQFVQDAVRWEFVPGTQEYRGRGMGYLDGSAIGIWGGRRYGTVIDLYFDFAFCNAFDAVNKSRDVCGKLGLKESVHFTAAPKNGINQMGKVTLDYSARTAPRSVCPRRPCGPWDQYRVVIPTSHSGMCATKALSR